MVKCNRLLLFAVCDGHKGDKAAQFFCDNVVNAFWEATVEIEGKEGIQLEMLRATKLFEDNIELDYRITR